MPSLVKPIAEADFYSVTESGTLTVTAAFGLLANDYDANGSSFIAASYSNPAHGTVSVASDGSFVYTPTSGFTGTDSFTYTDSSGSTLGTTGTVTITVTAPPLTVTPDSYLIGADGTLTIAAARGLLANDVSSGGSLEATSFSEPAHGTLNVVTDGSFVYTPTPGYVGTDSFTYTASNGLTTGSATVSLDVVDAAPVVNADAYAVRAGHTLTVAAAEGLLANDMAFSGSLEAVSFSEPAHGTLNVVTDGSFVYTPNAGYVGADSFTYTDSDGVLSASGTVTLTVVDAAPVANPDFYHTPEGAKLTVTAAQGLLANDSDPDGDSLEAISFSTPAHGTVSVVTDGSFVYTPSAGFTGTDSFTYTISDGALTASGTASIAVTPATVAFTARPDSYAVTESGTLTVAAASGLLANDYGPGSSIIAENYSNPAHGTVNVVSDGSFVYKPTSGFTGTDSFTYTNGTGSTLGATGTVTIMVTAPPLTVTPDSYLIGADGTLTIAAARGLLANDVSSGGSLEATSFSEPAHGTLNVVTDGSFVYTPTPGYVGTDSFTYTASNGLTTGSATVSLDVVDAAPVVNADAYAVRAGHTLTVAAAQGLLANDVAFSGSLEAVSFSEPAHGSLNVVTDGSFVYTPNAGYVGADSFTYTDSDGVLSASGTVALTVVDAAPVANPDFYHTFEGAKLTVAAAHGLLANDSDPDGDSLEATSFSTPAHGTVSVVTDGSFVYTPSAGFTGTDSFTYTISDGALTNSAVASIDVVACFAAGTRIAVVGGARRVEELSVGDRVISAFGGTVPVVWLGHRRVDCARHPRPEMVQPVRIRAGAIGPGVPARDLRLSPDHAVFLEGVLIPARCLVDGRGIVREAVDAVTYFHVELPAHDVVLAEGLAAESYLDTGNRAAFANGGAAVDLHADFAQRVWEAEACAPQVTHGAILARVRARIAGLGEERKQSFFEKKDQKTFVGLSQTLIGQGFALLDG